MEEDQFFRCPLTLRILYTHKRSASFFRTCALSRNELKESESQWVTTELLLYGGWRFRCKSERGSDQVPSLLAERAR